MSGAIVAAPRPTDLEIVRLLAAVRRRIVRRLRIKLLGVPVAWLIGACGSVPCTRRYGARQAPTMERT
jgi:hypothetical protein